MHRDISDEITNLFKSNFDGLFRYCAYRLFRQDFAEDAVSAVYVKLLEEYSTLREKNEKEIRNWLYGTASNVVAGFLRDKKRQRKIFSAYAPQNRQENTPNLSGDNWESESEWPVLYEAVSKLSMKDQEMITLRYFQGFSLADMVDVLNLKNVTVRVGLSRALKRLRRKLGENYV